MSEARLGPVLEELVWLARQSPPDREEALGAARRAVTLAACGQPLPSVPAPAAVGPQVSKAATERAHKAARITAARRIAAALNTNESEAGTMTAKGFAENAKIARERAGTQQGEAARKEAEQVAGEAVAALLAGGKAAPVAPAQPAAVRLTRGELTATIKEAVASALKPLETRVAAAERRQRK